MKNIFQLMLVSIIFQSCLDSHSIAIIENKTDSAVFVTLRITVLKAGNTFKNKDSSYVVFKDYSQKTTDEVVNMDTLNRKGTILIRPGARFEIEEGMEVKPRFSMDYLEVKSYNKKIVLNSKNEIENAFIRAENNEYKMEIEK